ncbi:MAG: DMT family transporter [Pseudomonadota bacterium]
MKNGYFWGIIAVLCWSTSATVAGSLDGKASYFQIVLLMQVTAIATLIIITLPEIHKFFGETVKGVFSAKHGLKFAAQILLFSAFITIYHSAFYYALHNAPRIQANIINYLWPLILFISGSTIFKVNKEKLGFYDIALVVLAFFGAFTIAWDPAQPLSDFALSTGLGVAFIAAFAAPIYMNTSVLIRRSFYTRSHFVYLAGFIISVPVLLAIANFQSIDVMPEASAIPYIVYLGIATIAIAHVAWTRAIDLGPSVTVSNLAYLVPVFSTLLLIILLGDEPSNKILFGATLIILSNVLSNEAFRRIYAESGAVIVFFYVSFSIYFKDNLGLDKLVFGSLDYLGQVFAIISGFFLARMWQKNREEQETLVQFATEFDAFVKDLNNSLGDEEASRLSNAIDNVMIKVADFDVTDSDATRAIQAEQLKSSYDDFIAEVEVSLKRKAGSASGDLLPSSLRTRGLLNNWIVQKFDRASNGEIFIISLLGFAGAVLVVGTSGGNLILDLIAMIFASSIAYIVLKIRDYNNTVAITDYSRLLIVQAPLKRIGRPYYIADQSLLYNKFRPEELGASIRFKDEQDKIKTTTEQIPGRGIAEYRRSRDFLVALLVIGLVTVIALLADKYDTIAG